LRILFRNTEGLNTRKLLSFNHLYAVTFLVDHHAVLPSFEEFRLLFGLPELLILRHLRGQLFLVSHEGLSALSHFLSFLFLLLFLTLNNL